MTNADLVAEFHRAVGDDTPQRPQIPSLATLDLRESLIKEECREVGRVRNVDVDPRRDTAVVRRIAEGVTEPTMSAG